MCIVMIYKEDIKKNKYSDYITALILFTLAICIYLLLTKDLRQIQNPKLINYETEFNGVLSKFTDYKGTTYFLLKGDEDYWKMEYSCNYDYKNEFIGNFIKKNDSLMKNACSDTLKLFRKGHEHIFIIGDALFNNKEKTRKWIEHWNKQRRIINEKGNCN